MVGITEETLRWWVSSAVFPIVACAAMGVYIWRVQVRLLDALTRVVAELEHVVGLLGETRHHQDRQE